MILKKICLVILLLTNSITSSVPLEIKSCIIQPIEDKQNITNISPEKIIPETSQPNLPQINTQLSKINGSQFLFEMVITILFSRFVSYFFYKMNQPRIVGDIIAGCLLGPTVFQEFTDIIFLHENRDGLKMLGYIGLIMSSISSGADFDYRSLNKDKKLLKICGFAIFNFFISFGAFYGLIQIIPSNNSFKNLTLPSFSENAYNLYFASIFATSSLPMTFLIINDMKITDSSIAQFVLPSTTIATIFTFTAVSIANSFESSDPIFQNTTYLILFRLGLLTGINIILFLFHLFWNWGLNRYNSENNWFRRTSTDQSLFIICGGFVIASATNILGYSYILGSFLFGVFLPFDDNIRTHFTKLIKFVSRWILLPMFFLDIGLQLDLRRLTSSDWGYVFLCLFWGFFFKALCVPFAKYILQFSWYDSLFLGSIANCRGSNSLVIGVMAYNAGKGQFGYLAFTIAILFSVISSYLSGILCRYFYNKQNVQLDP